MNELIKQNMENVVFMSYKIEMKISFINHHMGVLSMLSNSELRDAIKF